MAIQTTKGIDVSVWQGDVDFNKVKESGIDFVIIRAGYGRVSTQKDKCFEKNYKNAKKAGLMVGAYHYSYAKSVAEAKIEASVCLQWLKGKAFELPVYIDMEESSVARLGKSTCTAIAKTFCEALKAKGYKVGVYANLNWFKNYLDYSSLRKSYSIWLAQYNATKGLECDIWQNSSTGKVNGIKGNVDTNYHYTQIKESTNSTIKVGSKVRVVKAVQYKSNKPFTLYANEYDVIEVKGNRVVIGIGTTVTAAVHSANLKLIK